MSVVALVLGAGQGARLARGVPKAQVSVAGRSLLAWSASALGAAPEVDAVLCVVAPGGAEELERVRLDWTGPARLLEPTPGGDRRQASVLRGLEAAAEQEPGVAWVLVHDAARCLVEAADAAAVLLAARETGAALPVVPVNDTLKELDGSRVARTLPRERVGRAQTPQAFRHALLLEALRKAERDGFVATDCSSAVERLGTEVRTCAGREANFKVTHPEDLERAENRLGARK